MKTAITLLVATFSLTAQAQTIKLHSGATINCSISKVYADKMLIATHDDQPNRYRIVSKASVDSISASYKTYGSGTSTTSTRKLDVQQFWSKQTISKYISPGRLLQRSANLQLAAIGITLVGGGSLIALNQAGVISFTKVNGLSSSYTPFFYLTFAVGGASLLTHIAGLASLRKAGILTQAESLPSL